MTGLKQIEQCQNHGLLKFNKLKLPFYSIEVLTYLSTLLKPKNVENLLKNQEI